MVGDTIAAIATPFGQGAVSLVRVSGPQARAILGEVLRGEGKVEAMIDRVSSLREVVDGAGERIDEVLVTIFGGPASYTGEDVVEISGHGGLLVTQAVLDRVLEVGARAAEPGEFTQRAFLNGKMDLTQAEAVMDLIEARTSLAMRAAHEQLEGRMGQQAEAIRAELIGLVAHVEAFIDFPEDDIDPDTGQELVGKIESVVGAMDGLLSTAEQGRILREGVRTVICGAPNVGKSSLMNCLLGFDRAIVSAQAGTTRDTIEEVISLRGIPLRLVDTAGVRESEDEVERAGIERTGKQIANAELVIEVVDGSKAPGETLTASDAAGKRHVLVLNKCDLGEDRSWNEGAGIRVSCMVATGMKGLEDAIVAAVMGGDIEMWSANPLAINARHQACFKKARQDAQAAADKLKAGEIPELVALELRSSLESVGQVVGKVDVEEILGEIFGRFCIGK
ncbi:MAG: tRNA uridine-5-carboxymethylaminomethyl(34) synthesis GTPase MnmE [Verrucomicrobiota bacterium]